MSDFGQCHCAAILGDRILKGLGNDSNHLWHDIVSQVRKVDVGELIGRGLQGGAYCRR